MHNTPSHSTTLVLLSYNEEQNLRDLLPSIPIEGFEKVIAIDGGSSDNTTDLYQDYNIPFFIQELKGRGNAFLLAQDKLETDSVVFFSTDGNENPKDLLKLKNLLEEGYDMVVAGRYLLPGSETDNSDDPFRIRRWSGILGGKIVSWLWKSPIVDPINGFRGFSTEAMKRLKLDAPGHEIELQSTIRAAKLKMSVYEIPTVECTRKYEARKKSAGTAKLLYNLGRFMVREILIGKNF